MNSYHNTTNINSNQVELFEKKAVTQDQAVWAVFVATDRPLTASDVILFFVGKNWPITSIRRSMTNLKKKGLLIKTNQTKIGEYGAPEHFYIKVQ